MHDFLASDSFIIYLTSTIGMIAIAVMMYGMYDLNRDHNSHKKHPHHRKTKKA